MTAGAGQLSRGVYLSRGCIRRRPTDTPAGVSGSGSVLADAGVGKLPEQVRSLSDRPRGFVSIWRSLIGSSVAYSCAPCVHTQLL